MKLLQLTIGAVLLLGSGVTSVYSLDEIWEGSGSGKAYLDGGDSVSVCYTWVDTVWYYLAHDRTDTISGVWTSPVGPIHYYGPWRGWRYHMTQAGSTVTGSGTWWNHDNDFGGTWTSNWKDLRGNDAIPDTAWGTLTATWGATGNGKWFSKQRNYP